MHSQNWNWTVTMSKTEPVSVSNINKENTHSQNVDTVWLCFSSCTSPKSIRRRCLLLAVGLVDQEPAVCIPGTPLLIRVLIGSSSCTTFARLRPGAIVEDVDHTPSAMVERPYRRCQQQ